MAYVFKQWGLCRVPLGSLLPWLQVGQQWLAEVTTVFFRGQEVSISDSDQACNLEIGSFFFSGPCISLAKPMCHPFSPVLGGQWLGRAHVPFPPDCASGSWCAFVAPGMPGDVWQRHLPHQLSHVLGGTPRMLERSKQPSPKKPAGDGEFLVRPPLFTQSRNMDHPKPTYCTPTVTNPSTSLYFAPRRKKDGYMGRRMHG